MISNKQSNYTAQGARKKKKYKLLEKHSLTRKNYEEI